MAQPFVIAHLFNVNAICQSIFLPSVWMNVTHHALRSSLLQSFSFQFQLQRNQHPQPLDFHIHALQWSPQSNSLKYCTGSGFCSDENHNSFTRAFHNFPNALSKPLYLVITFMAWATNHSTVQYHDNHTNRFYRLQCTVTISQICKYSKNKKALRRNN